MKTKIELGLVTTANEIINKKIPIRKGQKILAEVKFCYIYNEAHSQYLRGNVGDNPVSIVGDATVVLVDEWYEVRDLKELRKAVGHLPSDTLIQFKDSESSLSLLEINWEAVFSSTQPEFVSFKICSDY